MLPNRIHAVDAKLRVMMLGGRHSRTQRFEDQIAKLDQPQTT